jgi:hypothetical protein
MAKEVNIKSGWLDTNERLEVIIHWKKRSNLFWKFEMIYTSGNRLLLHFIIQFRHLWF